MARKLEIEIVGDASSLRRALKTADKGTQSFGKSVGKMGKTALLAGGAAGVGGLAVALKIGIGEFNDAQKVAAQTNAVIKSTGGIANVTAKQVSDLSESLMKKSGVDDEVIASGENVLLTFQNIRNEAGKAGGTFDQATKAALDLSVAFGKDMQSSAILVGKALNDPIKGLGALSRVGIQFTEQQKKQIKAMVEGGNAAEAQRLILQELNKQVGGSAEALGNTLGGQINIVRERFNNWAGDMVAKMIPSLARFADWFADKWPQIRNVLQQIGDGFRRLADTAAAQWPRIKKAAEGVAAWYVEHLKPTILKVLDEIKAGHDRFRGDVEKGEKGHQSRMVAIVVSGFIGARTGIEGILALIRGDFSGFNRAMESLGKRTATMYLAAFKGAGAGASHIANEIGRALMEGIVAGVKAGVGFLADAMGVVIRNAINAVKDKFKIFSPSKVTAQEIGLPMAQGVAAGILSGKTKVSEAMVSAANAAVDAAKTVLQSRTGELGSWLQRAFQMKQGGAQTPTELLISEKELARQAQSLQDAINSAQADLAEARKAGKPGDIAAAQRALDDAQYNQWLAGAQRQAQAERTELENSQFLEQQAFEKRLAALNRYLESGHATTKGANARIAKLKKDFDLTGDVLGAGLGAGFVRGLNSIQKGVVAAAVALRKAVEREGIIIQGRKITIVIEEKAEKAAEKKKAAAGGPADTKDYSPSPVAGVNQGLWDEMGMAHAMGLSLSSGRRGPRFPGDNSKHIYGKAIDVVGPASSMARFALAAMKRPGIEDVFYSPLGGRFVWPGHDDHVHVEMFKKGGIVGGQGPQLIMAHGGETVLPANRGNVTIPISLGGEHIATVVFDMLRQKAKVYERQNGRAAFG